VVLNHIAPQELYVTLDPMDVRTHASQTSPWVAFVTPARFGCSKYRYSIGGCCVRFDVANQEWQALVKRNLLIPKSRRPALQRAFEGRKLHGHCAVGGRTLSSVAV